MSRQAVPIDDHAFHESSPFFAGSLYILRRRPDTYSSARLRRHWKSLTGDAGDESADNLCTYRAMAEKSAKPQSKPAPDDVAPPPTDTSASSPAVDVQMAILNALPAHVALLDASGAIVAVNDAWRRFHTDTELESQDPLVGQNYLDLCERASGECSEATNGVATGIRRVLRGEINEFVLEYADRPPSEERWYRLMVTPLSDGREAGAVVMHVPFTKSRQDESVIRRTERFARESELRLGFALGAADIGDWDIDLRTNVARHSLRHDQCFGYSEAVSEWSYDILIAHVHADDRVRVEQCVQTALSGAGDYEVEYRIIWPDGSVHWLWSKGCVQFDAGGAPLGAAGIVADITTRKHSEFQLRRHKASLAESQRIAHLGSWELDIVSVDDLSAGALRWSDEVFRIGGLEPDAIAVSYDNFLAAVHRDDRDLISDAVASALREQRPYDLIHRIVRPDGTERTVREQAEFEFDVQSGQLIRMIGTVLDITEQRAIEGALRRTLDRLQNAQRIGEIGDWDWDVTNNEISWSPQLFELTQRDPADGPPTNYAEMELLFDEPSREILQQHITRALDSGETQRYELLIVRRDGERIAVEAYAVPERDASGVVRFLRGTMQDISSRKRVEAVLAASEQRLELATQSAGIGIWDLNLLDDKLAWDERMFELYNIAEHDFAGAYDDWRRCIHPDDGQRVAAAYADALRGQREFGLTFRILWPSGEERYLEAHAVVQRDADGAPVRMTGVSWDVTTRKREEAALSQLADIVASSDDAIIGNDLESVVTSWNRGAEKAFGFSAAEMVGTSSLRLIPDDRQHEEVGIIGRVGDGESVEQFETLRRTRSGRLIEVSMTASPIRDTLGGIVGISTVARDISERKKLERQFYRAQRMESIGTLAGGIAHDLNNALSPIILSLDLLKESFPDRESQELLTVVSTSAAHAADMVRQVLSFARGVEGKRLEVDMRALVGDVEKISRDTFPRQIAITTRTAADLRPVLGDRTQLQQVLLNLCVNARDAMPNGGRLAIIAGNARFDAKQDRLPDTLKEGEYVCLRVEDSGEGISPDVIERIFEPFFTTKEVGKGTGLGLSTSMAIIKSHGGVMRVDSERARGATFTLYLPAHLDPSAVSPAIADTTPRGNGELILVVDDEPAVRLITKRILESYGYRVMLASDGASGLAQFDAHRAEIAVVLTDMMMAVMDGPTMIRSLRDRHPAVRIIGTSGLSSHEYDASSQSGLRYFVPKPCAADTLLRTLQSILADPT